jgi:FkbM family methyltransferase
MAHFNVLTSTRFGFMLYNKFDKYIGSSLEKYGEFSYGEAELFAKFLAPGMIIIDAGANIGVHTLCFARIAGMTGAVFAFEPQRIVFQELAANMALNSILNVNCIHAALGEREGSIVIPSLDYEKEANFGGLALGNFTDGEDVRLTTIDSLRLKQVHFIKIDVEGMEKDVLLGAAATIRRSKPILYVENDRTDKSRDLIRCLHDFDYDLYLHRPALYNPDNFHRDPENIFPNIVSFNLLCIPRSLGTPLPGFEKVAVD